MGTAVHHRVAGVLIANKQVLLVTGYDETVYWTPGGGKEASDKTDLATLQRELKEELGIKLTSAEFFTEYSHPTKNNKPAVTRAYLVKWSGRIIPQGEVTKTRWFSREEFDKNEPPISSGAREALFPKLIKEGLIDYTKW